MSFDPTDVVKPFPPRATEGGVEPGFVRLEPLITVEEMKDTYLFGLPLQSVLTKQKLKDSAIQSFITRAVSRVEHEAQIQISPVKFTELHDYKLQDFQKFMFIQFGKWPILQVESFRALFPFSTAAVEFPTDWLAVQNETGIIQAVPKSGTFAQLFLQGSTFVPLILNGGRNQWPQLFEVTAVCGFELDKIPAIINELVGTYAAIEVLRLLNRVLFLGSHSIGIDGISQSVSLPSPGWLAGEIASMEAKAALLLDKIKHFYNHAVMFSSI